MKAQLSDPSSASVVSGDLFSGLASNNQVSCVELSHPASAARRPVSVSSRCHLLHAARPSAQAYNPWWLSPLSWEVTLCLMVSHISISCTHGPCGVEGAQVLFRLTSELDYLEQTT